MEHVSVMKYHPCPLSFSTYPHFSMSTAISQPRSRRRRIRLIKSKQNLAKVEILSTSRCADETC